jgi:hypothetical protein
VRNAYFTARPAGNPLSYNANLKEVITKASSGRGRVVRAKAGNFAVFEHAKFMIISCLSF